MEENKIMTYEQVNTNAVVEKIEELNLKLDKKIIGTFTVNTILNPEYLLGRQGATSLTCKRNRRVAECLLSIDRLIESL